MAVSAAELLHFVVREEGADDTRPIVGVTRAAFREHPSSRQIEPRNVRGLRRLLEGGVAGCVVLGGSGVAPNAGLVDPGPSASRFMALVLEGTVPIGEVRYHAVFSRSGP